MPEGTDVAIVGGGIIGLSVAWHLARAGASVTVLERGQIGEGASGAAAGMLAPFAEAKKPGPFVELGLASLRRYPAFIESLHDEAGIDAECSSPGLLRVALSEEDAAAFESATDWQREAGMPVERLDGDSARRLEPALSPVVVAAVLSPEEKQYEPRQLVRALALACVRRGVRIRECTPVVGFITQGARVIALQTTEGEAPCGNLVIAGGAWTEEMGRRLGTSLPIFPVKGQILQLRCLPSPIRHSIYAHIGYLVPRADGRIVVGATAERAGFDTRPTAGGIASLLQTAITLIPSLTDAPFDSVWAGLRPASPDGLPILGPLPGWENAHVATGHFRNGILLAPITGEIIAQTIQTAEPHPLLASFRPERFG